MNNILVLRLPLLINYNLRLKLSLIWKMFFLLFLVFILFLTVFYIVQVNKITKESNFILVYQKEIKELSQENRNLEVKLFQSNSLNNIELLAQDLNYEKTGKVHYIEILGSTAIAK